MISRNIFCNWLNCTETTIPMYLRPSVLMGVKLSGCRTIGSSDYRAVGILGLCGIASSRKGIALTTMT